MQWVKQLLVQNSHIHLRLHCKIQIIWGYDENILFSTIPFFSQFTTPVGRFVTDFTFYFINFITLQLYNFFSLVSIVVIFFLRGTFHVLRFTFNVFTFLV